MIKARKAKTLFGVDTARIGRAPIRSEEFDISGLTERHARMQGLRNLARTVFLDRNAQGMPKRDRLKLKKRARPHLLRAIRHIRHSRDALFAGDVTLHEYERDRARMFAAFARLEFFRPYANTVGKRYAKLDEVRRAGTQATAEKYARPELDDLIRGCLARGEKTRNYAKRWAAHFNVSADTIERAINRVRSEIAGPKSRRRAQK